LETITSFSLGVDVLVLFFFERGAKALPQSIN
jgi:hypothetical protein